MRYHGIIITGTICSGKSVVAWRLCEQDERFACVQVATTRSKRADDPEGMYEYTSEETFQKLVTDGAFVVHAAHSGESIGIKHSCLEKTRKNGKVPVLVIVPELANALDGLPEDEAQATSKDLPEYLSFFIDASDHTVDLCLRRQGVVDESSLANVRAQREEDRRYKERFLYIIENTIATSSVELIIAQWDYSTVGGVLPARLIRLMLDCGQLLREANNRNIASSSYDLSLGREYYYGGHIRQLTDSDPILMIEPYDYAIVTSQEKANFPRDICARFDLSVGLFCSGVILSNGPQVDPGFRGPLFCLLFNTSSSPVLLKRGQHYATLEFHKLVEPTYRYRGPYQDKGLLDYLPSSVARGAINELKQELEQVRTESRTIQNFTFAALSLILALIAILIVFR